MKRKTVFNILLILGVLAFFVTPLGYYGKIFLNQVFAFAPDVIPEEERDTIGNYDWQLKDENWDFFNFNRSEGKVVFINFWASWRLPSAAELQGIQELYNRFGDKVDFYLITNEEREPVEAFMEENDFDFPVTYLIIGEEAAVEVGDPPKSYIIDRNGGIVVDETGIADWDNRKVDKLMDALISE